MSRVLFVRAYRMGFAVLTAAALVYIVSQRTSAFSFANFFSYFTVLSNLIAMVVLAVGAFRVGAAPDRSWEMVRGAAVLYMTVTGVVYAILLADVDVSTPGFSNTVLHKVIPFVVAVDWVIEPPRVPLAFRRTLVWLAFPLLYLPYTLIRGPIVDWYPYPFLDPRDHGYAHVAANCAAIAVAFVALTWAITWLGNRLRPLAIPG